MSWRPRVRSKCFLRALGCYLRVLVAIHVNQQTFQVRNKAFVAPSWPPHVHSSFLRNCFGGGWCDVGTMMRCNQVASPRILQNYKHPAKFNMACNLTTLYNPCFPPLVSNGNTPMPQPVLLTPRPDSSPKNHYNSCFFNPSRLVIAKTDSCNYGLGEVWCSPRAAATSKSICVSHTTSLSEIATSFWDERAEAPEKSEAPTVFFTVWATRTNSISPRSLTANHANHC